MIIPPESWRAQPWKNGGGVTHEILRWPDVDDYDVRVSVAEIVKAGPFSAFPGYRRYTTFLGPHPLELMFGREIATYTLPGASMEMLGTTSVFAMQPKQPTRLLNVLIKSDNRTIEWGCNVPVKPVRFAFVIERGEAHVFEPPERVAERAVWLA